MTTDRPIRRVRIDRIVVRGMPLTRGGELALRATLRRGLGADRPGSDPGDEAARIGASTAAAIRDAVARRAEP